MLQPVDIGPGNCRHVLGRWVYQACRCWACTSLQSGQPDNTGGLSRSSYCSDYPGYDFLLKGESKPANILVSSSVNGQVSITVAAIKTIISRAVKKVDGVKETRSSVAQGPDGVIIYLHMMINPEISVPEMSKNVQAAVKEQLESIGGLQVSEVRVLVDDFSHANKPVTA